VNRARISVAEKAKAGAAGSEKSIRPVYCILPSSARIAAGRGFAPERADSAFGAANAGVAAAKIAATATAARSPLASCPIAAGRSLLVSSWFPIILSPSRSFNTVFSGIRPDISDNIDHSL